MKRTLLGTLVGSTLAVSALTALTVGSSVSEAKPPKKSGAVSVAGAAFTDDSGDARCRVAKGAFASYVADAEAGDVDCDLVAGIQLPDAAELTTLTCSVYDGHLANVMEVYLLRVDLATGEPDYVFVTSGTVDSGTVQLVGDGAAEADTSIVDNGHYAYYVAAAFAHNDFSSIGTDMRVYGCTVGFEH
jgi:hypothetical protein